MINKLPALVYNKVYNKLSPSFAVEEMHLKTHKR